MAKNHSNQTHAQDSKEQTQLGVSQYSYQFYVEDSRAYYLQVMQEIETEWKSSLNKSLRSITIPKDSNVLVDPDETPKAGDLVVINLTLQTYSNQKIIDGVVIGLEVKRGCHE